MTSPAVSERAEFVSREQCIGCESPELTPLSEAHFGDEPLRSFIEADPWGVSPLPYLEGLSWRFVQCASCGQRFHSRILNPEWQRRRSEEWMTEAAIRQFEQEIGDLEPARLFQIGRDWLLHLLRLEKLTRSLRGEAATRVLDFGCGWGEFLNMATSMGFDAYGIDSHAERREGSSRRVARILPSLDAYDGEVGEPLHAASLFQVLEHLEAPLSVLRELHRRLVPGGVLILEVPNCEGVTSIRSEFDYRQIHPLDHINAFTPSSLRRIAENAGFRALPTPVAHASADLSRLLKTEVKRFAQLLMKPTTHQYFVRG